MKWPRDLLTNDALVAGLTDLAEAIPPIERRLWQRARQHVGGRDCAEVLRTAQVLRDQGAEISLDLFGTSARDEADVQGTVDGYLAVAQTFCGTAPWMSVDLSHLGLRWSREVCIRAARRLADGVAPGGRVQIGAEEATLAGEVLAVVHALAADGIPVMATVQANLRRSPGDVKGLVSAGIPIRLVKGAFPEHENVALAPGVAVDRAFHRLACSIHDAGGLVALATHDGALREAVFAECGRLDCEVSFGIRGEDVAALVSRGVPTRVYLPFGPQWLRFYLRRLAESP